MLIRRSRAKCRPGSLCHRNTTWRGSQSGRPIATRRWDRGHCRRGNGADLVSAPSLEPGGQAGRRRSRRFRGSCAGDRRRNRGRPVRKGGRRRGRTTATTAGPAQQVRRAISGDAEGVGARAPLRSEARASEGRVTFGELERSDRRVRGRDPLVGLVAYSCRGPPPALPA